MPGLWLQKLLDLAKKPLSVQETWETRYEQLMEQFASDMCLYMGMVSTHTSQPEYRGNAVLLDH